MTESQQNFQQNWKPEYKRVKAKTRWKKNRSDYQKNYRKR